MTRPRVLVVATGTGTDVGKTWWGSQTLATLRTNGCSVAARKPVQSGTSATPTDADVLASATGEASIVVCPTHRCLKPALAPPIAAARIGVPGFTIADLAALDWPPGIDVGWVEGAGGIRSPLADDGDTADLIARVRPDLVVLVADANLGTINATRLSADAIHAHPLVVALNRFDAANDVHVANRDWLTDHDGFDVVTDPVELAGRIVTRP